MPPPPHVSAIWSSAAAPRATGPSSADTSTIASFRRRLYASRPSPPTAAAPAAEEKEEGMVRSALSSS